MIAAGAGSLDAVRQLVRHGADVNAAEPRGGQTALMWAAAEGHSDVVAGLVEMGANVNAASKTGFTPLVFAAIKNDVASIKTLLEAGANPERRPALGRQTAHRRDAIPAHGCRAGAARGRRRHQRARSCREHDAASGGAGRATWIWCARSSPNVPIRTRARRNRRRRWARAAAAGSAAADGRRADAADAGGARRPRGGHARAGRRRRRSEPARRRTAPAC